MATYPADAHDDLESMAAQLRDLTAAVGSLRVSLDELADRDPCETASHRWRYLAGGAATAARAAQWLANDLNVIASNVEAAEEPAA